MVIASKTREIIDHITTPHINDVNKLFISQDGIVNFDFDEKVKMQFYKMLAILKNKYGCNYISYFCELSNHKKRICFSTDTEWINEYVPTGLIKDCPLMAVGWKFKTIMLDWNTVGPCGKKQRNVVGCREEFGYYNGFSISNEVFGMRESLGLATEKINKDFTASILEDLGFLCGIINKIGRLTVSSMRNLGWLNNYDAKGVDVYTPLSLLVLELNILRSKKA